MSLNWNVEKVERYEEVCYQETGEVAPDGSPMVTLRVATEALIWASMSVGLGGITARNWKRWWARLSFCERLDGGYRNKKGVPFYFTPEEVRAHIGLTVNVPEESDEAWRERHVDRWVEVAVARAERAEIPLLVAEAKQAAEATTAG